MITAEGYSKDPSIVPEGIVITWGKDMIEEKGGLKAFLTYFHQAMEDSEDEHGSYWMNKCKNAPQQDIIYVYIIVANRLAYRCYYGVHQTGLTEAHGNGSKSWSRYEMISWPRILMAGPVERCPFKRTLKGFQGFRYCTKLF